MGRAKSDSPSFNTGTSQGLERDGRKEEFHINVHLAPIGGGLIPGDSSLCEDACNQNNT